MRTKSILVAAAALAMLLALDGCAVYEPEPLEVEGLSLPSREWTWEHPSPQGQTLTSVWGTHPRRLWAVGYGGVALQFDGTTWRQRELATAGSLHAIWGTDDDDVFIVGDKGLILHFDGRSWSTQASGTTATLTDIWGTAADNVYAVGQSGTVLHYDGTRWTSLDFSPTLHMVSIWGRAANDIYLVAFPGRIYHFDGASWDLFQPNVPIATVRSVWGPPGGGLVAFGYSNTLYRLQDDRWEPWLVVPSSSATTFIFDIWGTSLTDLHLVGDSGLIGHYNGQVLKLEEPTSVGYGYLLAVLGFANGQVFAVGERGMIVERRDGVWRRHSRSAFDDLCPAPGAPLGNCEPPHLLDVEVTPSGEAYAMHASGLLRRNRAVWEREILPSQGPFTAMWCSPQGTVFLAGDGVMVRGDHDGWEARAIAAKILPRGVHGNSADDVYALAEETLLHFDGTAWSPVELPRDAKPKSLWSVGDRLHLLAGRNAFWIYDGREWTNLRPSSPNLPELGMLWGLPSGEVYAIGESGSVSGYREGQWASLFTIGPFFLRDMWGSSPDDLYLLGLGDEILRFDGKMWLLSTTRLEDVTLRAIVGAPDSGQDLLAVGTFGSILRRHFEPLQ